MSDAQAGPVEFGPDALRLIDVADRTAAGFAAGAPAKRAFDGWRCVGRALLLARTAIAERFGGRDGHLGRPWRDWLAAHPGLASIKESERAHSVWLALHETEVVQWRDGLPQKQRDRIVHVASVRLAFTRHLREAEVVRALGIKREDQRRAADRAAKILHDLAGRFVVLEREVVELRERVMHLEAQAVGPMTQKAEDRHATWAA